jgi:hypothetical protein
MSNIPYGYRSQRNSDNFFVFCLLSSGFLFVLASLTLPIVILAFTDNFKLEIRCSAKNVNTNVTNAINITNASFIPLPPNTTFSPLTLTPTSQPASVSTNLIDTIGIYSWMIAHGVIGIFEVINVSIFVITSFTESDCGIISFGISLLFLILMVLFRFCWLIVGGVMFWRDCPNLYPSQMNDLMWATLIIGFIGLWTSFGFAIGGKKK